MTMTTDTTTTLSAIEDAIKAWTGWDWAQQQGCCECDDDLPGVELGCGGPGNGDPIILDGPGALGDWEIWQSEIRDQLVDAGHSERCAEMAADTACEYGEACSIAAAAAAAAGRDAIRSLRDGHPGVALEHVRRAASEESEYGDDPVWGPVVTMIGDLYQAECEADIATD
jgi:hypothetical protein